MTNLNVRHSVTLTEGQISVILYHLEGKDGEEIKRYQADLSFKMLATRKEIQNDVDELLMSDY